MFRPIHIVYGVLSFLQTGALLLFMALFYGMVGCILGVLYLFLSGEEWSQIPDKLPVAAMVLPIFLGVLFCTALKMQELWDCVHRDRYMWARMFFLLLGYTMLPIVLNGLSVVVETVGFMKLSVSLQYYRYRALGIVGCIGLLILVYQMYRYWKFERRSKKQIQGAT